MFFKPIKNRGTGRIAYTIAESYRDENKKPRQKQILNLGYLDQLEKVHKDPEAYARELARKMTEDKNSSDTPIRIEIIMDTVLEKRDPAKDHDSNRKNIGYAALSKIYHQLELHEFMNNRRRYTKAEYNLNTVFKVLVYNRALFPDSKLGAWERRGLFFEDCDFSLPDVYRSLDFFLKHRSALLRQIHAMICKEYGRDSFLFYYDVTNYYFETDYNDPDDTTKPEDDPARYGLRKRGVSKEHKPNPIVQMGLFMDENGLPVSYELYKGNKSDCVTFTDCLDSTEEALQLENKHKIEIADKAMMTGDNVAAIRLRHDGYVISESVRRVAKPFRKYVLDQKGYTCEYDKDGNLTFKYKSRLHPKVINVTNVEDKKVKETINERQIVFYSEKYARRAKKDRALAIEKAKGKEGTTSNFGSDSHYGAAKYLNKTPFDKKDGELITDSSYLVTFDEDKLSEDEEMDGYYIICTNVIGLKKGERPFRKKCRYTMDGFLQLNKTVTDMDIIEMYRGLWKIEETFKVTKTNMSARPVFVWTQDHIRAHFLICFVSLVLFRLLEFRLDWKYSATEIQENLAQACGSRLEQNLFIFDHYTKVLEDIGKSINIDFSRKYLTTGDIRGILAETKKYKG
ncbi:MAG: IS1634 family transposase [Sphaerochaeta sp.]